MTIFWLIAGGITVVVLLMLVIPMLAASYSASNSQDDRTALNVQLIRQRLVEVERDYTQQRLSSAQYTDIKQELQLALAKDLQSAPDQNLTRKSAGQGRWMAWVVAIFIPIMAVLLYLIYGDLRGFDQAALSQAQTNQAQPPPPSAASIEKMVDGLAERLKLNPDDQQGWFMLGRSYMVMERYSEASDAYAELLNLVGDDVNILLQFAQAKLMSNGGQWESSSIATLKKAVKLEPNNPVALSLAGLLASQQGQAETAVGLWRKAQKTMQPNSAEYNELDKMIASSNKNKKDNNNRAIRTETQQPAQATTPQTSIENTASAIKVEVSIAPELIEKANPEHTIFIFAQALNGPPMPIAVARKKVSELPVAVTLDDSMAMMPTRKLSSFKQVRIAARISQSGSAMPAAGDLQGKVEPVDIATTQSVTIVIDQVL